MEKRLTFGYALTGSFCTFERSVRQIEALTEKGINIIPIMSYNAYNTDTRFGTAEYFIEKIERITGKKIIHTLTEAEPIGPKNLTDLMIVLPCSGNTLAKLRNGIYDTPVTLAVKSHLRNQKPVLIGVSSNDSLSSSAKNIGELLNFRHYYFIPMTQDNPQKKPFSIVCDFEKVYEAAVCALKGEQIQPIIF
ncbi:MAG: dipicolinate synthase subunit B [Clostridia bacterium]|nr:dipicolinate synthase subunit B [Clostridia bacterium]